MPFVEIPGSTTPYVRLLRPVQNHFLSAGAEAKAAPAFAQLHVHLDRLSVGEAAKAADVPQLPEPRVVSCDSRQQAPSRWHGTPRRGKAVQFYGSVRIK